MIDYFEIFRITVNNKHFPENKRSKIIFIFFFFYILVRDFVLLFSYKKRGRIIFDRTKFYVHVESLNNFNTLSFLEDFFHFDYTFRKNECRYLEKFLSLNPFITYRGNANKYLFMWRVFFSSKYSINKFVNIDQYFECYSNLLAAFHSGNKPKAFFLANDHSPFSRSLILACNKNNIPCFYYQHGSVSKIFPPLKFTASFLYGNQSLEVYQACGPVYGDVFLTGIAKFDDYQKVIEEKRMFSFKRVGVCFNPLDDIEKVNILLELLVNAFPEIEIIVRPHPRDLRKVEPKYLTLKNLKISDSTRESSPVFLSSVDIVIADNSGILLEAALMNVWPIKTELNEINIKLGDYYGYIEKGLVSSCPDLSDIVEFIRNNQPLEPVRNKAKYFDASIGSDFEFNVEKQIANILITRYGFNVFQR